MLLTEALVRRFADEEIFVEIQENVRGEDVFVIQSTGYPVNDNLMELLIMIDALKRASASRITAVIPISAMRARTGSPAPHADLGQAGRQSHHRRGCRSRPFGRPACRSDPGFFDIPTDNLYAAPVMSADILARFKNDNLMVVSPDVGGVVRARQLAKRSTTPLSPSSTSVASVQANRR